LTPRHRHSALQQANDPQRLRGFLQRVAEAHGSASAKKAKSVLHGVIGYAVDNGVLSSDATRQVRTVTSTAARSSERDHTRAMTRSERDHVIEATLLAAREPGLNPRTMRKRRATADLIAFLAGTGARIDEARHVRSKDTNLERGRVYLRGTKSETSDRWLNLPDWLVEQLAARAADCGAEGYVFAAPAGVSGRALAAGSLHDGEQAVCCRIATRPVLIVLVGLGIWISANRNRALRVTGRS
jgi:integrase